MKIVILLVSVFIAQSSVAQTNDPPPTGKLVDIGGYRLHIDVRGKGTPTVILIAGSAAYSFDWSLVLPKISRITKACTYDRPALAWSDAGPMPRTFDQDVYELHTLLERAGVKPPFILVGHSLGGIIARKFEKKYPAEVSGIVLVDATSEDAVLMMNNEIKRLRLLSRNRTIPGIKAKVDTATKIPTELEAEEFWKTMGEAKTYPPFDRLPANIQQTRLWASRQPKVLLADNGDYWAEEFAALFGDSLYTLGNKPLFVLSSGKVALHATEEKMREIFMEKLKQKEKMSSLSSNNKHIITTKSGHEIHLEEPELVIEAIKAVVEAARTGRRLR